MKTRPKRPGDDFAYPANTHARTIDVSVTDANLDIKRASPG